MTFWLVLAYFIHSLQSSGSKYLLELIWEILYIFLILWVFSLSIYIYMLPPPHHISGVIKLKDLPNPGIGPDPPALQEDSLPSELTGKLLLFHM